MPIEIKRLRLIIIICSVLSTLSLFSLTMTVLAWGGGDSALYFLILYPLLILSTILLIPKIKIGYVLILFVAICYCILLNRDIGHHVIFGGNSILSVVLVLPYILLLAVIPLSVAYLSGNNKTLVVSSVIISLGLPVYAIAERANRDYTNFVFAEFEITDNGLIKITCKPQPSDTRQFFLTSTSKELALSAKSEGTFLIDYYYVANTAITARYAFTQLQSVIITHLNKKKLSKPITWQTKEMKGDLTFIRP